MLAPLERAAREFRSRLPFRDSRDNPVVLLLGSGRSGTTWLAELIASHTAGRIVFEPLYPFAGIAPPGMARQKYLAIDEEYPELHEALAPVIHGESRSRWTDQFNDRWIYHFRVVKFIRANMLLGWLARSFPAARMAYVVRNPADVVRSQLRHGWPNDLGYFLDQENLCADYPRFPAEIPELAQTQFERAIAWWVMSNRVALDQMQQARRYNPFVELFRYEELKRDREQLRGFLEFCTGRTFPDRQLALQRASKTSEIDNIRGEAKRLLEPSAGEVLRARRMLELFGLESFAPFPDNRSS